MIIKKTQKQMREHAYIDEWESLAGMRDTKYEYCCLLQCVILGVYICSSTVCILVTYEPVDWFSGMMNLLPFISILLHHT